METKMNKELWAYIEPQATEIKIESESILAGMESGGEGEEIG